MTLNHWAFALALLAAGLLLGEIAGRVARSSLSRPDRPKETRDLARLVGALLFWGSTALGLILAVALASPETLERIPDQLGEFLPDLLVAGVFLIAGYAVSIGVAVAVGQSVLRATGVRQRGLERLLRVTIVAASVVLALSQIGVDTTILALVTAALLGAPSLALALLTGFGGRDVAHNIAAGRALRSELEVDRWIRCHGPDGIPVKGIIVAVHPVTVEVLTDDAATIHVPLGLLLEQPFEVHQARAWTP